MGFNIKNDEEKFMTEDSKTFAPPFLQLVGITKSFGSLVANNHINLEIERGEVHALLGENGSGKTTLMNTIYGLCKPDSGQILINGQPASILSPRDALNHRIGMVHQHFMLIPNLSVTENIILGLDNAENLCWICEAHPQESAIWADNMDWKWIRPHESVIYLLESSSELRFLRLYSAEWNSLFLMSRLLF
jgi:ABC-type uncharacterized transport system ATPase subunit